MVIFRQIDSGTTIRKQANLFERLYESLPDGVVLTNANGEILRVNAQAEKLFGYSRAELLGQPVEMLIPERFPSTHIGQRHAYHQDPRALMRIPSPAPGSGPALGVAPS